MSIAYSIFGKKVEMITSLVLSEEIGYLEFTVARENLTKSMDKGQWIFEAIKASSESEQI